MNGVRGSMAVSDWWPVSRLMQHPNWSDPMYLGPRHSPWTKEGRRAFARERLAEMRRELRAGESNHQRKEPVDTVDTQERADHNGQLPGPVLLTATDDLEVYCCGCEWHSDGARGLWFPCKRAQARGWEFCDSTSHRET